MKILRAVVVSFLAIGPISAQFGNVVFPGGHIPHSGNPWGNVVLPAIPNFNAFSSVTDTSFAGRLGGVVTGFRPYNGAPEGHHRGGRVSGIYAYPVFVGGGYGGYPYGYDQPPAQQQPNVTVVYPPAQPPVIINQNFGPAQPDQGGQQPENIHMYQAPVSSAPDTASSNTTYYLIAFKDHTIYSAVAYYTEGDTLHYFTSGNTHNQVSLSLVDRQLTEQLNRERSVDVRLPR